MSELLIKMLQNMIPKDALKNTEIEIEWENEDENTLVIFITIKKVKK
jgi:hypothetical protein